ncbi:YtxH domain-containing protein [Clostridium lundense]|uniref:YtxH domain-containing protein n=1 Tax=Clostridium lundense TaxID=319475 RepID=UPI000A5C953D|nr:YtxH domain-containing protein [Clostridium lundense]
MQKRFLTGMILGAAATMLVLPEMDRSTQRRIKRANKQMRNMAGDTYDNILRWMK